MAGDAGRSTEPAFGSYRIDVALTFDGVPVAVECDAWYWQAGRELYDAQRDRQMIAAGWRILHIRSNTQLPAREQVDNAVGRLLAGEMLVQIVLDDWGVGPAKFEVGLTDLYGKGAWPASGDPDC